MATTMAAFDKIERAHQMYRDGLHQEALGLYTDALAMAKTKPQKIALHSNRAACYLKLHDFKKAAEECTSVLELDHQHTGALMLRAQTLVTLKEYQSALFDVNRLMELNPSSDVYQNLQARLKTQLSLAPIPEAEEDMTELEEEDKEDEEEEVATEGVTKKIELSASNPEDPDTKKIESPKGSHEAPGFHTKNVEDFSDTRRKGWVAIPKPKGHSRLDYSRWDSVDDDSNDDDDEEEEEQQPQYRFRVRTVGMRSIK